MRRFIKVVLLVLGVTGLGYSSWLFLEADYLPDSYIFCQVNDEYRFVDNKDRNLCNTGANIKNNHFSITKGYKPFKSRFNPFAKEAPNKTVNFTIFYDYNSTKDSLVDVVILKKQLEDRIEVYEKEINFILDYLYVGYVINFTGIYLVEPSSDLSMKVHDVLLVFNEIYLSNKGYVEDGYSKQNKLVISKDIDLNSFNSNDPKATTRSDWLNVHNIFSDEYILGNPYLFVHEFFHYASNSFFKHDLSNDENDIHCDRSKNIMQDANTTCMLYLKANRLLELSQGDKINSDEKLVWPMGFDTICCPNNYSVDPIKAIPILLIHLGDLFEVLDRETPYSFFDSVIELINETFIIEENFNKSIEIECKNTKMPDSETYRQRRLDSHKKFLERNAKAGINHLLKNKRSSQELGRTPLKVLAKEYYKENETDPKIEEIFKKSHQGSLNFRGNNSFVMLDDFFLNGNATISAWFKMNGPNSSVYERRIMSFGGDRRLEFGVENNQKFWIFDQGANATNTTYGKRLDDGLWHNFTWVRSGKNRKIFIDGVNVGSYENNNIKDGPKVRIGQWPGGGDNISWNGNIDEVHIWKTAKSTSWVKSNYNCLKDNEPDLLVYYNFKKKSANNLDSDAKKINPEYGNISGSLQRMRYFGDNANWAEDSPNLKCN